MWFRNLRIFRLPKDLSISVEQLDKSLAQAVLFRCEATDAQRIGWVSPTGNGAYVNSVNRQWLIALGVEQKLLPASVIKQAASERAIAIEEAEGRRIGRKELRELRESIAIELLPRAFIRRYTTFCWIDPVNGWLVVDAGTHAKAEVLLEHLRKSIEGFSVSLLKTINSPMAAMTGWVAGGEAPAGFTVDHDSELRSAENATVRYSRHSLEGKDVREHIAEGKVVTRLGMTWNDRISFVIDEKLQIKRLSFLDILKEESSCQAENEEERFDLDFTLMTGELARMFDDLIAALGGEKKEAE